MIRSILLLPLRTVFCKPVNLILNQRFNIHTFPDNLSTIIIFKEVVQNAITIHAL